MLMGTVIMSIIGFFRDLIKTVYELDTAMISLKKVTNESTESYNRFLQSAIQIGNELGRQTKDVIESATSWARLGYSMQDSLKLGTEALVLANVGLMDADQATRHLISTLI